MHDELLKGAAKDHDWACERLAAWLRSTGTKVKTQSGVTAVNGDKRGDLELAGYISNGAQDLVLELSFRHYRAGAAPKNWHRNGSCRPSPALQAASIASCCACSFCTRTGRRHASSRSWSRARATTHISVQLPPRCFLQHTPEQHRSHGSEGCGAPAQHQHRWPHGPDQETVTKLPAKLAPLISSMLVPRSCTSQ